MSHLFRSLFISLCLSLSAFSVSAAEIAADKDYVLPVEANELKIMSYNVENLFDAEHDEDKSDFEYLPKSSREKAKCPKTGRYAESCRETDWTPDKVELKYRQIQRAIEAQGDLPDILVLVEVENQKVIKGLAQFLGYDDFVMTESPDERGIDCAILFLKRKLRPIQFIERELTKASYATRNISAMLFQLDASLGGGTLAVSANHWPSQGNPVRARIVAADAVREMIDDLRTKYKGQNFQYVLTGDFNVIDADKPHPIESVLFDSKWAEKLVDLRELAKSKRHPLLSKMPKGTYYYAAEDTWNELDRFLLSGDLYDKEGLEVDPLSYRIVAPNFLSRKNADGDKIPFRYNHNTTSKAHLGFSDHYSIVMKLKYE